MSGCAELKCVCRRVGLVKVAEHIGQLLTDWAAGERWSRWTLRVIDVKQTDYRSSQLSTKALKTNPVECGCRPNQGVINQDRCTNHKCHPQNKGKANYDEQSHENFQKDPSEQSHKNF